MTFPNPASAPIFIPSYILEAPPATTPEPPAAKCRYVRAGIVCRFGDACRFSHDVAVRAPKQIKPKSDTAAPKAAAAASKPAVPAVKPDAAASTAQAPAPKPSSRALKKWADKKKDQERKQDREAKAHQMGDGDAMQQPELEARPMHKPRRAVHIEIPGIRGLSREVVKGLTAERLRELQEAELKQTKRRFASSYVALAPADNAQFCFEVLFQPSDPDFAFELPNDGGIAVRVSLPRLYPNDPPTFAVPAGLPAAAATRVAAALNEAARHRRHQPMLRSLFIYLDRSLESLLCLPTAAAPAATTLSLIARGPLPARPVESADDLVPLTTERLPSVYVPPTADESTDTDDSDSDSGSDVDDADARREEAERAAAPVSAAMSAAAAALEGPPRGTAVHLSGLSLSQVGVLTASVLGIMLVCGRCRQANEVRLLPLVELGKPCMRCNNPLLARFRPSLAHIASDVLGFLDLRNCTPRDIAPPTTLELGCARCSRSQNVEGAVAGAADLDRHCHGCHAHMRVAFASVRFLVHAPAPDADFGADARQRAATRRPAEREVGLVPGTPLPDEGTCRHYRRSRRWMRFGCCGRLFACSECHDEAMAARPPGEDAVVKADDVDKQGRHIATHASRMVCGLCSREQPILGSTSSPTYGLCIFCGADTTGRRRAKIFWEGGKGCRDPARMNKNDVHKTKGMAKVASKRLERVGVQGKNRVAARTQRDK